MEKASAFKRSTKSKLFAVAVAAAAVVGLVCFVWLFMYILWFYWNEMFFSLLFLGWDGTNYLLFVNKWMNQQIYETATALRLYFFSIVVVVVVVFDTVPAIASMWCVREWSCIESQINRFLNIVTLQIDLFGECVYGCVCITKRWVFDLYMHTQYAIDLIVSSIIYIAWYRRNKH